MTALQVVLGCLSQLVKDVEMLAVFNSWYRGKHSPNWELKTATMNGSWVHNHVALQLPDLKAPALL
jgi:hypothetical protein